MDSIPRRSSLVAQTVPILRDNIQAGVWQDLLPGELELCAGFQVSRVTLRAALLQLEQEGRFRGQQGKRREIIRKRVSTAVAAPGTGWCCFPRCRSRRFRPMHCSGWMRFTTTWPGRGIVWSFMPGRLALPSIRSACSNHLSADVARRAGSCTCPRPPFRNGFLGGHSLASSVAPAINMSSFPRWTQITPPPAVTLWACLPRGVGAAWRC
jgi:hypothetical protein